MAEKKFMKTVSDSRTVTSETITIAQKKVSRNLALP
jgi:hypothetical protein